MNSGVPIGGKASVSPHIHGLTRVVNAHTQSPRYIGRTRVDSKNVILILVFFFFLRCLRKIIVPIICWVASETLNRQCSTSESLSNLEASFGLISRFESIAHRYNYFVCVCVCTCLYMMYACVCVYVSICECVVILRLSYFFCFSFVFNYYLQRTIKFNLIFKRYTRSMYSGTVSLEYHADVTIPFFRFPVPPSRHLSSPIAIITGRIPLRMTSP